MGVAAGDESFPGRTVRQKAGLVARRYLTQGSAFGEPTVNGITVRGSCIQRHDPFQAQAQTGCLILHCLKPVFPALQVDQVNRA